MGWAGGKYLIDGFPRSQNNLDGWKSVIGDSVRVDFCLFFSVSEEVMTAQKQAQQLEVSEMTTHSARRARAEDAFYQHIDSYTKVESPRQDKARDTEPLEVPLARDKGPLAREDLGEGEASDDEEVRRAYIV